LKVVPYGGSRKAISVVHDSFREEPHCNRWL
jgi:hypothetical protein